MKHRIVPLALAAAFILPADVATAAVIGTYDYDYSDTGNRSGQGRDQNASGVLIVDDGVTFRDSFNFGNLAGAVIDSFELTFAFSGAGPLLFGILESWEVTVEGSDPLGSSDDLFAQLVDDQSTWTGAIDASTAPGNSFFADAVANMGFNFAFDQSGSLPNNSFRLASVSLAVNGTAAVVPLPAPGLLLLGALAGMGLMRRRKTSAAA
ncbi:VPLPA-CTERM protein sorting domain-containing protein [Jannaschia faecimaris]|uniref:VPLPA-CTERM protein sorting domain-containing protein n=1 Tax=Jannaschia faecimaris TaxID=1244108 RepID=A0A1H3K4A2_9RHOB|nr:VPLPA-CTERM sorting domain-containing protein [Jannaschia faecimaris]SDY46428.1 VPLPA-CTERM protein sorting domain-containing protein [Jannaschia faecimaris]